MSIQNFLKINNIIYLKWIQNKNKIKDIGLNTNINIIINIIIPCR